MEPNYKHDVFISYYHEDEPHARRLFEKMDAFGLRVFWSPKTLDRGVEFPNHLGEALLSSQHFALYWSSKTHLSTWIGKEADIFLSQCHIPDKDHRRMYVFLESSGNPDDLPGTLRDLNRPQSPDELVTEVVKIVLSDSRQQCAQAIAGQGTRLSQLQHKLEQERRKVEEAEVVPVETGADGVIRVSKTRVTLDTLIAAFKDGATPEEIAQQYPAVPLADVYAVIAYYLKRPNDVEAYLGQRRQHADQVRIENESRFSPTDVRKRLMNRRP